ncbi:helix-turn-helix domain-containing protein [Nonomuraea fuscirosea]|uniref:helix-turn-helix domain-containing protein n=1 Tax=Nonomuraea fuscirosea TaxID=1291556 RepID=UPI0033E16A46
MPAEQHPVSAALQGSRLRKQLRVLRKRAGLTQEDVAQEMEWSTSKVIRIEGGAVKVSINDLKALLDLYDVEDRQAVQDLIHMARATRRRPWWHVYQKAITKPYADYIGHEDAASRIDTFEPILIPGLLQTREYAESVFEQFSAARPNPYAQDLLEVRMKRQEILDRDPPPALHCLLDESVIRRYAGETPLMARQLRVLAELGRRESISIRIVPFTAGLHPGLQGAFTLFELPGEQVDVLFLEDAIGVSEQDYIDYITEGEDPLVIRYKQIFVELAELALSQEESAQLILDSISGTRLPVL